MRPLGKVSREWSPELAYAIGLIATDGCLYGDGRHINLTSKDLDQIKTFAKILGLKNQIGEKQSGYSTGKVYYNFQFGDVLFYKFLESIGLTSNKSKTIGELNIPDRYFADFLRGHLDGDGCTYSYFDPRWKSSYMIYTQFISASNKHLEWLRNKIDAHCDISGKI